MLNLFKQIAEWRRETYVPSNELEFHWNDLHSSVIGDYFSNLSTTCDFPELPSAELLINGDRWVPQIVASFTQELKEMFVVPRLIKFDESQNRIRKCRPVEGFLSFLLQLLYHKADPTIVDPGEDRVESLEKELRFLLTILGDISRMLCDEDEQEGEFQSLLAEFEAVANQAGSFVHSLLFSPDRAFEEMDEVLAAVSNLNELLKANLQSCISTSAYATPRTSVVDSFLIVDSLVGHLEDLLKREDNRIADVKDQINLLHQRLILLHSSINDMRLPQASETGEVKVALMRIGDKAHQAEYLITSYLVRDVPLWYLIIRFTDINHKIEHITMELQVITKKYQFGGLKELPLEDHKKNTEVSDVTVGFEDKATDILDQLVGGGTESLQVISIFGMPGLGKTTLAKKLYNHSLVNYTFEKLSWCVVSPTYKRQSILADILIHINSELDKDSILKMEEETLLEHIYKTFKGRRYLIVMDDIWDSNAWDSLRRCFPDDGNGSRILLTSRIKDVAPPNSIIHELPFLSNDQCWELLEKKVFGTRICLPELQEIGKKIAAKCCGLPLMVVVIAGILSTMDEEVSTWEEVGGSLASYIDGEDNSVMRILELSYKHLPEHLKPCFLYFGAFEEDKEISVGKLKRLWVAEGFIRRENGKSAENIAEEYLMELIDRSLVMVAKRRLDGRGIKACGVHDLLRDLCLKKSEEESFLKHLKSDYQSIYEKGHRVRAHGDSTTLSHCQHLHSFICGHQFSSFYVRDMKLLRVLHFNYIHRNHIYGVEYLVNLRFLVIGSLPSSIDRLLNLEYLFVTSFVTVHLPPSIVQMNKLRYFDALLAEYGEDWNSCQTCNNLQVLSSITIRKLKDEEMLKCSPHLRKLKCRYNPREMEKRTYPHFDLSFLTQLDSLCLSFYRYLVFKLKGFRFPSNIRKLTLSESRLSWKKMSIVGRLENLEFLRLNKGAVEGERWNTRDGEFQKLRFLQLDHILLSQWNVASYEHFPKLQQLILISCSNLEEIPGEIGEITALELIEVKSECPDSLVESAERIKQEQRDMGNEELRVIINTTDSWKSSDWIDTSLDIVASILDSAPVQQFLHSLHKPATRAPRRKFRSKSSR